MSRIDEALRMLEEADGIVVSEVDAVSEVILPLSQYGHEDRDRHAHDRVRFTRVCRAGGAVPASLHRTSIRDARVQPA